MPALLTQVQEALGLPMSAVPPSKSPAPPVAAPVPSTSRSTAPPVLPSSSAPPIVAEDSDSDDPDVQTLPVPFRSGNSDTYLPMISLDESWHSDNEFRFVYIFSFRANNTFLERSHFLDARFALNKLFIFICVGVIYLRTTTTTLLKVSTHSTFF